MSLNNLQPVVNFGGNLRFTPHHRYTPRSETEVLEILNKHAQDQVRVAGSLHAWSDVAVTDEVLVDMGDFDQVELEFDGSKVWATIGAGTEIDHLIHVLHEMADISLPTVPNVPVGTIGGLISTGAHASGLPSLSHFGMTSFAA